MALETIYPTLASAAIVFCCAGISEDAPIAIVVQKESFFSHTT